MDFKLNFLGVTVSDFEKSYRFYTEVLGIEVKHFKPGWAAFQTTGMKFELFSGGTSAPNHRSWGQGQAIRPSFQVADLKTTVEELRRKGVVFVGDMEKTRFSASLQRPHIGGVEMKTYNFKKQQAFYSNLMGLPISDLNKTDVIFRKGKDDPLLVL